MALTAHSSSNIVNHLDRAQIDLRALRASLREANAGILADNGENQGIMAMLGAIDLISSTLAMEAIRWDQYNEFRKRNK